MSLSDSGIFNFFSDEKRSKRRRERSISSDESGEEPPRKARGPRTPSDSPSRSPTESGFIETIEALSEKYPSTWKGVVGLKKNDYLLKYIYNIVNIFINYFFF